MDEKKIDGKRISGEIKEEVRTEAGALKELGITVTLAVILVGQDPASKIYVRNKMRACEYTGIRSLNYELPESTTEEELLNLVHTLNERPDVDGILVQLPLPAGINEDRVLLSIDPGKDVDGFHPYNVGRLSIGDPMVSPCTPAGIMELLKRSDVSIDGANAVIVGRSNIVGKPMGMLLLNSNATVTICHSHTKDLPAITRTADILVCAVGKPKFFHRDMVKKGAVVIDVGMDHDEEGHLCGDADYEDLYDVVSKITPVPGGVGPMTIAMLMKNCLQAGKSHHLSS